MMATNRYDLDTIRQALGLLVEPGAVVELRALGRGVISGYFNDLKAMAQEAAGISGTMPGVYVTLNSANPALLARSANRMNKHAKATSKDDDIVHRTRLLIDLDPVRPSGVSATDEEHDLAIARAKEVRAWLCGELGWPEPLFADSGNGAHLIFGIDLPNDAAGKKLVEGVLAAIAFRYADERVVVDTTVSNAGRVSRVYGTMTCKGDNIPDRPHRLSQILNAPDKLAPVTVEQLNTMAASASIPTKAPKASRSGERIDVDQWVAEHQVPVVRSGPWNGGRRWVINPCPWDSGHANRSAYIVQFADGGIAAGCHHNGCKGKGWPEMRDVYQPGWRSAGAPAQGDALGSRGQPKGSQSEALLDLAAAARLFHTPEGLPYASIPVGKHHEAMPIDENSVGNWLRAEYFHRYGKPATKDAIATACALMVAQATFNGPQEPVYLRIAERGGNIYLDLGNADWQVVEICRGGWRVVDDAPVHFWRPKHMLPLPAPVHGGNLGQLRDLLNLPEDGGLELVVGWLLMTLNSAGPYPALIITGEQGSGKSGTSRMLRELVDPAKAINRGLSGSVQDLMVAAKHNHVVSFDNLSNIPGCLADALCRLSTGGGFGAKTLYTNAEETIIDVTRPVIMNGIDVMSLREDLLNRAIVLELPRITDERRRPESLITQEFEQARPALLGALLTAVSTALANLPSVVMGRTPRMADFAYFVVAAEPALPWEPEGFMAAYDANRRTVAHIPLDTAVLVDALHAILATTDRWSGTPTQLYAHISEAAGDSRKLLPATPRALSATLRRLAPSLRAAGGIDVTRPPRSANERRIILSRVE